MKFRVRRTRLPYKLYEFSYFFANGATPYPASVCPLAQRMFRAIFWTAPIWLVLEVLWLTFCAPIAVAIGLVLGYYPDWTIVMPSNCYPRRIRKAWFERPSFRKITFLPWWYPRALWISVTLIGLWFYLPYAWEGLGIPSEETYASEAKMLQVVLSLPLGLVLMISAFCVLILVLLMVSTLAMNAGVPEKWRRITSNSRILFWAIKDRFCPIVEVVD